MWTKLIRNGTPIDFLYNAESYDFNHQIVNQLATPIKLYPVRLFHSCFSRIILFILGGYLLYSMRI